MPLPIDRTDDSTVEEHVADHNTLHAFFNDNEGGVDIDWANIEVEEVSITSTDGDISLTADQFFSIEGPAVSLYSTDPDVGAGGMILSTPTVGSITMNDTIGLRVSADDHLDLNADTGIDIEAPDIDILSVEDEASIHLSLPGEDTVIGLNAHTITLGVNDIVLDQTASTLILNALSNQISDDPSNQLGFYGTTPINRPSAVSAKVALQNLGLGASLTDEAHSGAGANSILIGGSATSSASQSIALGYTASSTHANSTALGQGATTTAANQIMLGTSAETVFHPGVTNMGIVSPQRLSIWDDFIHQNTSNGDIGQLAWREGGTGSMSIDPGVANHPGISVLSTGAVSSDDQYIHMGDSSNQPFLANMVDRFVGILRLNSITNVRAYFGMLANPGSPTGAEGIWFEFNPASNANWKTSTRAAATETVNNTAVAVTANNWYQLEARRNGANWEFYINGTLRFTHSTNVPTTGLISPVFYVTTTTTADKEMHVDYFALSTVDLGQRWT